MARDINITASCAHCGEVLDTNEVSMDSVIHGEIDLNDAPLIVGTQHECFEKICTECGTFDGHDPRCTEAPADFSNYQE